MENRDPNVSVLLMPTKHHLMSQTFQNSCTGADGKLIYKNKSCHPAPIALLLSLMFCILLGLSRSKVFRAKIMWTVTVVV